MNQESQDYAFLRKINDARRESIHQEKNEYMQERNEGTKARSYKGTKERRNEGAKERRSEERSILNRIKYSHLCRLSIVHPFQS